MTAAISLHFFLPILPYYFSPNTFFTFFPAKCVAGTTSGMRLREQDLVQKRVEDKERMTRSVNSFPETYEQTVLRSGTSTGNVVQSDQGIKNNTNQSSLPRIGCASPEVLVNGSPSPEIVETVGGGTGSGNSQAGFGNIEEIQFVGIIGSSSESNRRICRIKCVNGVWVGPLCTLEKGMT